MKVITTSNYKIELYDSIHNLPAWRDVKIDYYLLEDTGLGTNIEAIGSLFSSIVSAARSGNAKDVETAVYNIMSGIYSQIQEYRPDFMAWACMIKSINGEPFEDLSWDNVKKTIKMLSDDGLTIGDLDETFEEIKKKFPESWTSFFRSGQDQEEEIDLFDSI